MDISKMTLGAFQSNCYIIKCQNSTAVIIDPGAYGDTIVNTLKKMNLKPTAVLLTHGHFDHIGGLTPLKEEGAKIYINKEDEFLLLDPSKAGSGLFPSFKGYTPTSADGYLSDGDDIKIEDKIFSIIHTPGHTNGSVLIAVEDVIFSGDTLFNGSIGRTDFIGSDQDKMKKSLEKIKKLDDKYSVMPGHGEETTLKYEKITNPYLGTNYDDIF